jgi:hypothetical protein
VLRRNARRDLPERRSTQLRNFKRNLLFLTVPAVLALGAVSYG